MSAPSTPLLVAKAFSSNVPCAGVLRKSLHAYSTLADKASNAVPSTSLDLSNVFIVSPLECGAETDSERSAARIDTDVDVAELVADVAGCSGERPRRQ